MHKPTLPFPIRLFSVALCVLCGSHASAQDLTKRPPAQDMPIALVHATVHPIAGPDIADGFILFDKGVITEVGSMDGGRVFAATIRQIDCKGKHVYPSLISPATQVGLVEHGMTRPSMDYNEVGELTPEVAAATAVNPDSTIIPVTRANGVLVCGVFPTGGLLPGRASVIRLEGWTSDDMTVKRSAGQTLNWPMMRTITAWWMDRSEDDQRKDIAKGLDRIKETFRTARAYIATKDGTAGATPEPTDLRWEAMRDTLAGKSPIFISANDYDQITAAVTWAVQEHLKPVIVGGQDAHQCAALLKKHDVPVILSSTVTMPRRDDAPFDEAYVRPAQLQADGVHWCLTTGQETPNERNLSYAAALAVANGGLDHDAALRAITLSAAQILGVDGTLGSLEKGKEATLFVTTGDCLEVTSRVDWLFVQGKQLTPSSKQSELAEKYREKYRQMGKAPKHVDE